MKYEVRTAFVDYDGGEHPVGECWTYLSYNFLPYDDGLSLFVSLDKKQEWHIRLQDRPEEQGAVVRAIHEGSIVRAVSRGIARTAPPAPPRLLQWDLPRWTAMCAIAGGLVGGVLAAVTGGALAIVASAVVIALIAAFVGRLVWQTSQWHALCAAIPAGTPAEIVEALLGAPTARIDLFPSGEAAATHLFEPAVYTPLKLKRSIACDFDAQNRLLAIRRL